MKATKCIGQRDITGDTKDYFIFSNWFSSKKLAEAAIDFGADMISMVKTNRKLFCKEAIENIPKEWLVISCLVLRRNPMVPGGRTLIAIGYKYNARKVLYFIVTT